MWTEGRAKLRITGYIHPSSICHLSNQILDKDSQQLRSSLSARKTDLKLTFWATFLARTMFECCSKSSEAWAGSDNQHRTMLTTQTSGSEYAGYPSQLCKWLALWNWVSSLTSISHLYNEDNKSAYCFETRFRQGTKSPLHLGIS